MATVTRYGAPFTVRVNAVTPPSTGNALNDAAIALAPGASAAFPIPSWNLTGTFLRYNVRWHWDPVHQRAYLMGKNTRASSDAWRLIEYTAATNLFATLYNATLTAGGTTGVGQGYDSGALDNAGVFHFLPLFAENVIKWAGSAFEVATGNVTGGGGSATGEKALAGGPNLYGPGDFGLVVTNGAEIRAWRQLNGPAGTWAQAGQNLPYSGAIWAQSCYCAGLGAVVTTAGTAGLGWFRVNLDDSGFVTSIRMPFDLPVPCTSNQGAGDANMSRLMPTPNGSLVIFESAAAARVWLFNLSTYQWDLQSYTHPLRLDSASWPTMFDSTRAIYWALREINGGNSPPDSLIYRLP